MLKKETIKDYLKIIHDLKAEHKFYDMHVHPFEVIYNSFKYNYNSIHDGLYSLNGSVYKKPEIDDLDLNHENKTPSATQTKCKLSNLIGLRKIYSHVGPKVLEDHMQLVGIDEVLLLPVARSSIPMDFQMKNLNNLFGANQKFHLGLSIPNTIGVSEISAFIQRNITKYHVTAIKLHPNISQINLKTASGKQKVESILSSCARFKLPLIIHGGRSRIMENEDASEFGHIKNFENIKWDMGPKTVIIAHAGALGCDLKEIEQDILPRLEKLMAGFANLKVDISGLCLSELLLILKVVDIKRIFFGSDLLYHHLWAAMIVLIHALRTLNCNIEESLIQVANINPYEAIFKANGYKSLMEKSYEYLPEFLNAYNFSTVRRFKEL